MIRLLTIATALLLSLVAEAQIFEQYSIPDSIWTRMQGKSYPKGCTMPRSELRYLRLSYYDAEAKVCVGEMVCNRAIAQDLVEIFRELYGNRYRIGRMTLIDDFNADDNRSMEANNTSCFCYRKMTNGNAISKHGLGMAIDINPLYNPYVKGKQVEPEAGRKYAFNRTKANVPMLIDRNDLCYKLFTKHGFRWGGAWRSAKDYQHFEK